MEAKSKKALETAAFATAFDAEFSRASSAAEAEGVLLDELLRREQDYLAGCKMFAMEEVDRMAQEMLDEDQMVS